jgi:SAM-dependent methyltransferase
MQVNVLHVQRFELPQGHPLADGYNVVACQSCGFVYADTEVTQTVYDYYYANFSKYQDARDPMGGENPVDVERLKKTVEYVAKTLTDKQARVLDVGCANGAMLGALKYLGYLHLNGIDPSPVSAENAKQRYDIVVYEGSLSNPPQDIGRFDLVILSHVLEHVKELKQALNHVRELQPDKGFLYVEVPDASRYADFVYSPFQDFNIEHINHFSLYSLTRLLQTCGFHVREGGRKTIESAPGIPYPVIFVIAVKMDDDQAFRQTVFEKDEFLRGDIQSYIDHSKQMMFKIKLKLDDILLRCSSIIVWGTGQLVMKLLAETALAEANINAFVDSNPINQGQVLRGIPILAPEQIVGMTDPIVIGSTLHHLAISKCIKEQMKLSNDVIYLV